MSSDENERTIRIEYKASLPDELVKTHYSKLSKERAFTLIEIVVVTTIIAIMGTLVAVRVGIFSFWNEQGFLRRLGETITFLHYQATVDRLYYQIDFDMKKNSYRVLAFKPIKDTSVATSGTADLTNELAVLLSPALGISDDAVPPQDFPSLAEPVVFPDGMKLIAIHTPNIDIDEKSADGVGSILFSPRGIVDGAILEFTNKQNAPVNVVINPFTGLSRVYREEVNFNSLLSELGDDTDAAT